MRVYPIMPEPRRTEERISRIQEETSDYTRWHQSFVDTICPKEFDLLCERSARDHPYAGNPDTIL